MRKLFFLFAALTLSVGLWADGSVFTYTATSKLEYKFSKLGTVVTHEFNEGNGTVTYDGTVTEIGRMAFDECSALLSITIPEGVTTIEEYAFQWCESLQSVTLPTSLTTIGMDAFLNCFDLQSITIPAGVTTMGTYAFAYCTSLASVTLSPGVTTIGEKAFEGCSSLPSITIPASVTTIGRLAFSSCSALQSVTLSEGLPTIGEGAFAATGLTSVTIPASVTEIVETAFYNCSALASVTFLGNACQDAIGNNTFYNVGSTTPATLVLPANWTGSKPDANGNWYGGKFNYEAPAPAVTDIAIIGDLVVGSELTFTATVANFSAEPMVVYAVKAEGGDYVQAQGGKFTSTAAGNYTVKATATYVPDEGDAEEAFKEVEFTIAAPAAPAVGDQFVDATSGLKFEVTAVGETNTVKVTFNNDYTGSTCTVPATVKYKDVDFAVTEIGTNAFGDCSTLSSITLPESVTTIGMGAFRSTGVTSITIPANVTTIGDAAFLGCSLQSITIPAGVTEIGENTFFQCSSLASVTLPEGLTTIEMGAFANCASLAAVTLEGNSCQEGIADDAFANVGATDPALLTLPNSWTGTLPDEDGKWYGGVFEMSEIPTGLIKVDNGASEHSDKCTMHGGKFMHKGRLIIDANGKRYNAVGF